MKRQPRPKKSLGQNFLTDINIAKKIVGFLGIEPGDFVLEIGPGPGVLTKIILESFPEGEIQFTAVEKDNVLSELLSQSELHDHFHLIHDDFLKVDLNEIPLGEGKKWKVIGNIPYNITTPIIFHLVEHETLVDKMILTVQKEFAERLAASSGKTYGRVSVMLGHIANVSVLYGIDKGSFKPVPKVDSAVVEIDFCYPREDEEFEKVFAQVVKNAFQLRRKKVSNNLKSILSARGISQEALFAFFEKQGIPVGARAEDISVKQFEDLTRLICKRV